MSKMKPNRQQVFEAGLAGNIKLLREYANQGAEFNQSDENGEPLLHDILLELCYGEFDHRFEVLSVFLELGANPNLLGDEECNAMFYPMICMDTEVLRILLEAGANPNLGRGSGSGESFYDYAEFDYRYQVYDLNEPEEPTDDDRKDEGAWLQYLDRMAVKHNKRRPDHLFLLRSFGAKTFKELHEECL